jgi:hypothetical protein
MLVADGAPSGHGTTRPPLAKGRILSAVARRGLPNIVEATLIPSSLFILLVATAGTAIAMVGVFAWSGAAILRRVVRGAPIPALLVLATIGLVVRTSVGLLSGSTFAYFLQPIATTVALAAVFLGSVLIGRPVIARLAHDFCPLDIDVARRPAVVELFAGLTVLWAGVHLLTAAATLGMLMTMPVTTFVAVKTVTCLAITVCAIVVTILWALRTARREHLVFAAA